MAKEKPPIVPFSMEAIADSKRKKDITFPLPNREIRRKYEKLKDKPHFKAELSKQLGHTATKDKSMDEDTKAELLKHLDVQRFLNVLNGLLTGTKKLVIESKTDYEDTAFEHSGEHLLNIATNYTHTFRVEDVDVRG